MSNSLSAPSALNTLSTTVENLKLDKVQRHIFLCCDQSKDKCCRRDDSLKSWNFLKNRLKQLGLDCSGSGQIFRTKANCLRVCQQGPIAVVYPDNVWYHSCDETALETIIQQHLINGEIAEDYVLKK